MAEKAVANLDTLGIPSKQLKVLIESKFIRQRNVNIVTVPWKMWPSRNMSADRCLTYLRWRLRSPNISLRSRFARSVARKTKLTFLKQ